MHCQGNLNAAFEFRTFSQPATLITNWSLALECHQLYIIFGVVRLIQCYRIEGSEQNPSFVTLLPSVDILPEEITVEWQGLVKLLSLKS